MVMIQHLKIHNQTIEYHLTYRDQKNLILKFRDGQIFLSAPLRCSSWVISQFLYRNSAKLIEFQRNYQSYKKISLDQTKWILVFNKPLIIELWPTPIHTKLLSDRIIIYNSGDQIALKKKIYNFLAQQYKNWFINRTQQWAKLLNVEFKNVSLRIMVSKWGVCYPQLKKITYNTKLIHYDPQIIDYVIVHELTHLIHPNHSPLFWHSIQKYLPNYPQLKAGLKI